METPINNFGLFILNLPQMVAFYRDGPGFEIDWDVNGAYAEFKQEGTRFSMKERSQLPALLGQTLSFTSGITGTFEIASDLPFFSEVDSEFARVAEAGAQPVNSPRNEPWGMRSSIIADPEGNLIEIGS